MVQNLQKHFRHLARGSAASKMRWTLGIWFELIEEGQLSISRQHIPIESTRSLKMLSLPTFLVGFFLWVGSGKCNVNIPHIDPRKVWNSMIYPSLLCWKKLGANFSVAMFRLFFKLHLGPKHRDPPRSTGRVMSCHPGAHERPMPCEWCIDLKIILIY